MTTIGATLPTIADVARRLDPKGAIDNICEALMQRVALLKDAVWLPGNLPTGHKYTSRTGLPSVGWRRFNQGVALSKSRTAQHTETFGMLTARSEVDVKLCKLNGNEAAFRASEERPFMQAMNHELERATFYASKASDPEQIQGFAPRFNATAAAHGSQIIKGGGSGNDNMSIWLIVWGPDTAFMGYPKGSTGGLSQRDLGEVDAFDSNSRKFRAYANLWEWDFGLVVRDWRAVVRICNIDVSALDTTDTLIPLMLRALDQVEDLDAGRPVFYANRKAHTYLRLQSRVNVKNSTLTTDMIGGKRIVSLDGVPIRMTDGLTLAEATIT